MKNHSTATSTIGPSILGGVLIGILVVFFRISLAALIFSGELSVFLVAGIGIMLLGSLISGLLATFSSEFSVTINGPQDIPAVLIGVMAVTILSSSAQTITNDLFSTIVILMMVSSLLAGATMWLFGHYNLGRFVRYIPYPVIGGFIAGTGWLLVSGGINVVTESGLSMQMLSPASSIYWIPSFIFAIVLLVSTSRSKNPLILPITLVVSLLLFFAIAVLIGGSVSAGVNAAMSNGWLIGPLPEGDLWQLVIFSAPQNADWSAVLNNTASVIVVALMTTVAFMLNCSSLEVITRSDIDLNRELKMVGHSNLLGAAVGSSPGYHMLSLSTLTHRMGATNRISGIIVALVLALTLFAGTNALNYAPKFIIAGFVIYLGLSFLAEWLYDGWFNLPKTDYFLVWFILLVIAATGILQGVLAGLFVAIGLFVMAYTNTDVVRHTFTRDKYQSSTMRAPVMEKALEENGDRCYIMELQGFLFFGMAHKLLDQLKARIKDPNQTPLDFLLLDFRLVTGIDSSASYSFSRLQQIADQNNIILAFSDLSPRIHSDLNGMDTRNLEIYDDINHAISSFDETEIKRQVESGRNIEAVPLVHYFQNTLQDHQSLSVKERLSLYMQFDLVSPGTVLLNEGQAVDFLYFIESGEVCVQTVLNNNSIKKLRVQGAGTVVGEIGIYSGATATADVVVTKDAEIFRISSEDMQRMEISDPDIAVATHRFIAMTLGRKLTQSNSALLALQR